MNTIEHDFWSDSRPYYMFYLDKGFIKNMYAQIFNDSPDVGEIAYIGANTRRLTKDYSVDGEEIDGKNKRRINKEENIDIDKKKDMKKRAGLKVIDSSEESEIREYANIREIKEMNNMLFYKRLLRKLTHICKTGKCKELYHICDKIETYQDFKDAPDIFVRMKDSCVWLKKENLDTSMINVVTMLGTVHMLGYVIQEKTETTPRIIKALAIYT